MALCRYRDASFHKSERNFSKAQQPIAERDIHGLHACLLIEALALKVRRFEALSKFFDMPNFRLSEKNDAKNLNDVNRIGVLIDHFYQWALSCLFWLMKYVSPDLTNIDRAGIGHAVFVIYSRIG